MTKNHDTIHIVVAENAEIVRTGVMTVLQRSNDLNVQLVEVSTLQALNNIMLSQNPEMLIVSPSFEGHFDVQAFRRERTSSPTHIIALLYNYTSEMVLRDYDGEISIFDDTESIVQKIHNFFAQESAGNDNITETLSNREREILVCVVRGYTNREIADQLFISIHTVITHRRNIARKLQIHSTSGLTIYAIVNKLIELDDVKP